MANMTSHLFPTLAKGASLFGASATEQANRTAVLVRHHEGPATGSLVAYNQGEFYGALTEGYCEETGHPHLPGHGPCEVLRACSARELHLLYGVGVPVSSGVILAPVGPCPVIRVKAGR